MREQKPEVGCATVFLCILIAAAIMLGVGWVVSAFWNTAFPGNPTTAPIAGAVTWVILFYTESR